MVTIATLGKGHCEPPIFTYLMLIRIKKLVIDKFRMHSPGSQLHPGMQAAGHSMKRNTRPPYCIQIGRNMALK